MKDRQSRRTPRLGEVLWLVSGMSDTRNTKHSSPVNVSRVGKKYFYIENGTREIAMSIYTWHEKRDRDSVGFSDYELYENQAAHLEYMESVYYMYRIRSELSGMGINKWGNALLLSKLRAIGDVLGISVPERNYLEQMV